MRELPEVEVLRRDLERDLPGRRVGDVEVRAPAELVHVRAKKTFTDALRGATVAKVTRVGVALLVALDDDRTLVVRLGDRGLVRRGPAGTTPAKPDVSLALDTGPPLGFFDLGSGGGLWLVGAAELDEVVPERAAGAFDPLDDAIPWNVLGRRVIARREPLRRVLLDPAVVAGLGDCYVDEVLFEAGLRHDRPASNLSVQEVRRLYRSLVEVVHDAVKHRGTSIGDAPFVDLAGRPGEHAEHLQVHGRDGRPSTRSRTPVRRTTFEGRVTYFCDTQV